MQNVLYSLVEALGFGLPVISTFVGGTAEVVEDEFVAFYISQVILRLCKKQWNNL